MKRILCYLVTIATLMLCSYSACAAIENITISEDASNGEISISGSIDSLTDAAVTVIICDESITSLNVAENTFLSNLYGAWECETVNKNFTVKALLPEGAETGTYACFITAENISTIRETFPYTSPFEAQNALRQLNGATSSDIEEQFNNYCSKILFDTTAIDVSGYDKEAFFAKLLCSRPADGFQNETDFAKYYNACVSLQTLEDTADNTSRKDYITANEAKLLVSLQSFTPLSDDIKLLICAGINKAACLSPKNLQTYLDEAEITCSFKGAKVWNDYKDLILKYTTVFTLEGEAAQQYSQIRDKNEVFKRMFAVKPSEYTIPAIKTCYINAINFRYTEEKRGGGSNDGESYSGGGPSNKTFVKDNTGNTEKPQTSVFGDVSKDFWACEAIEALTQRGIIAGVGNNLFMPDKEITREEFVKIIVSAFNITASDTDVKFSDVDKNAWYASYIGSAVKAGIINGKGDNYFGIGEKIIRQDMATMIYRCFENSELFKNNAGAKNFEDSFAISDYAKAAVEALAGAGVINGMSETRFQPKGFATRAQAAMIVYKVLKLNQ